jgi:TATA-box binding protein (TBP) (component of TFIID and TFIIIB)
MGKYKPTLKPNPKPKTTITITNRVACFHSGTTIPLDKLALAHYHHLDLRVFPSVRRREQNVDGVGFTMQQFQEGKNVIVGVSGDPTRALTRIYRIKLQESQRMGVPLGVFDFQFFNTVAKIDLHIALDTKAFMASEHGALCPGDRTRYPGIPYPFESKERGDARNITIVLYDSGRLVICGTMDEQDVAGIVQKAEQEVLKHFFIRDRHKSDAIRKQSYHHTTKTPDDP